MPFLVLIVEDDTDLIRTVARRLRRFGPTCLTGAPASEVIDPLVCDRPGVIHHARRS